MIVLVLVLDDCEDEGFSSNMALQRSIETLHKVTQHRASWALITIQPTMTFLGSSYLSTRRAMIRDFRKTSKWDRRSFLSVAPLSTAAFALGLDGPKPEPLRSKVKLAVATYS